MTVQEATEAANFNTNQLWLSLGGTKTEDRIPRPGEILLGCSTPDSVKKELRKMCYKMSFGNRTSGPIHAIYLDRQHGSLWA